MPGKFKAYMGNIQEKTGKPEDFWKLVNEKGFIMEGKIVVKHGDILTWLKTDIGLGMFKQTSSSFFFGCELAIPR